jgi:hypothetical protein
VCDVGINIALLMIIAFTKYLNLMKYFTYLIVLLSFNLNAQNKCDYDSIQFILEIPKDTILTLEPFHYTTIVINQSFFTKNIVPLVDSEHYPIIEYQTENDTLWQRLEGSEIGIDLVNGYGNRDYDLLDRPRVYLPKKEYIIEAVWIDIPFRHSCYMLDNRLDDEFYQLDNIFSKPGQYKIRLIASNASIFCKKRIVSNEASFYIKERTGIDKAAKDWLVKNTLHPAVVYESLLKGNERYFGKYTVSAWMVEGENIQEKLEAFIELFPNSSFSPWVRLHLAKLYFRGFTPYIDNNYKNVVFKSGLIDIENEAEVREYLSILVSLKATMKQLMSDHKKLMSNNDNFNQQTWDLYSKIKRNIFKYKYKPE